MGINGTNLKMSQAIMFLQILCPSGHDTDIIKALKRIYGTDTNQV